VLLPHIGVLSHSALRRQFRSVIVLADDSIVMPRESIRVNVWPAAIVLAATALMGCDPVVNIAGANFPAWLLCAIIGALGIAAVRPVILLSGLDPYLWWRPGFYSSLGIMIACLVWVIFFNRT
jgi:hypothetical protein